MKTPHRMIRQVRLLLALSFLAVAGRAGAQELFFEKAASFEAPRWSADASVTAYLVPDDHDYLQPTLSADRGRWHLEGRYNYEALNTGSAWLGWNFEGGDTWEFEFTPMFGAVFGQSRGVAPGCRFALDRGRWSFYTEMEWFLDATGRSENFFYAWSQLTYAPWDWLHVGVVGQRTRAFHTGLEVERGVLVALVRDRFELSASVFNLGWERPTVVLSLALHY